MTKKELIHSPDHYTHGGIETIDFIKAKLTPEEFRGYLKGSTLKYMSRLGLKNEPLQDAEKARWFTARLIEELKCL